MNNTRNIDNDRRSSVRVSGRNLFYCETVSKEQLKVIMEDYKLGIPPYNQEGLAEIQVYIGAQRALARIKDKDNDLGEFLSHLDTKMNLMLTKLDTEGNLFSRLLMKEVTMSGSGIDFVDNNDYDKGTILALHITLLPDYSYIYCLGKVVSSSLVKESKGKKYFRVAVEYVLIMDEDREMIIQHNFKQQSLALRNRRLSK
jgi:hypothetical protein